MPLETHCQCCGKALVVYVEPVEGYDWTHWIDMAVCDPCYKLRDGVQKAARSGPEPVVPDAPDVSDAPLPYKDD